VWQALTIDPAPKARTGPVSSAPASMENRMRCLALVAVMLVVLSSATALAATRCPSYDVACQRAAAHQARRPGNLHGQAEQQRAVGQSRHSNCSSRPHIVDGKGIANDPACR
jgi:hypothetical protein